MKKIEVIVERTGTGYSAYTSDMPIATTGEDLQIITSNIVEAINFYIEETEVNGRTVNEQELQMNINNDCVTNPSFVL